MGMSVYINLPVAEVKRSRDFFARLGFGFDDRFSDQTALAMTVSDTIHVMLLSHDKFASFTPREIADAHKASEALIALRVDSREAVDAITDTALANSGSHVREAADHGFMYGRAFADPDGHIWEPFWMDPTQMPERG